MQCHLFRPSDSASCFFTSSPRLVNHQIPSMAETTTMDWKQEMKASKQRIETLFFAIEAANRSAQLLLWGIILGLLIYCSNHLHKNVTLAYVVVRKNNPLLDLYGFASSLKVLTGWRVGCDLRRLHLPQTGALSLREIQRPGIRDFAIGDTISNPQRGLLLPARHHHRQGPAGRPQASAYSRTRGRPVEPGYGPAVPGSCVG